MATLLAMRFIRKPAQVSAVGYSGRSHRSIGNSSRIAAAVRNYAVRAFFNLPSEQVQALILVHEKRQGFSGRDPRHAEGRQSDGLNPVDDANLVNGFPVKC